ncbi:phosphoserine phosphatase SerB [Rudaeicoccus suwonensis]|uniref:phosphoserine phosphatase n=1 Tax=Rudaeicoccus suwonensis TaxID=657409 RepID=A0A561EAS0_9MICO|nr:phosphoserine phosphatase SerB [Rudaeicoccus suwonensis]TWE12715.1 phosphoserine phosphatase [Rudaeicoccus suwonensis]
MNPPDLPRDSESDSLLFTITGIDRPGVSGAVMRATARYDAAVLDLEQSVVRGHLLLCGLLRPSPGSAGALSDAIRAVAAEHDLRATIDTGRGDNARRRDGRASVVVIGAPLLARSLAAVTERIAQHGANIDRVRRLARDPVTTLELDVSGADVFELRRHLTLEAAAHGVDIAVAPGGLARRGRRLVVMDVDSTLIQDEVIELLAAHAGRGPQVAAVTERAMRGEIDFATSLHERVSVLAGLPESVFDQVRSDIRLTPGARTLVRTVKRLGFTVAVVSGGFQQIVEPLAHDLGIDYAQANVLEIIDGTLTGRITGQIVDRAEKARALRRFADREGLPLARTVAIGDGANDLDMLAAAGLGIAFNAKPVVRSHADATVNVPYLDAVLFMLGISRDEIEEADRAAEAASVSGTDCLESPHV